MRAGTWVQLAGVVVGLAGVCLAVSVPAAMITLGVLLVAAVEARART